MTTSAIAPFDALYTESPDPWGTRTRWYERRKRALLMAALPRERYATAFEAGCGTGHVSAALATRCDRLLASDASDVALAIAAASLKSRRHVSLQRLAAPDEWPAGRFELVVLGELLYFVDATARVRIAERVRSCVEGDVVACHWRHPIEGYGTTGEAAHRHFEDVLALPRLFEYVDEDFVLTGWSADPRTPAVREGLR